jgi:hypothetical protein
MLRLFASSRMKAWTLKEDESACCFGSITQSKQRQMTYWTEMERVGYAHGSEEEWAVWLGYS